MKTPNNMSAPDTAITVTPVSLGTAPPAGVLRKVAWRLIPFLCVLYLFNIVDRANVGFARRQIQSDRALRDLFRIHDGGQSRRKNGARLAVERVPGLIRATS